MSDSSWSDREKEGYRGSYIYAHTICSNKGRRSTSEDPFFRACLSESNFSKQRSRQEKGPGTYAWMLLEDNVDWRWGRSPSFCI